MFNYNFILGYAYNVILHNSFWKRSIFVEVNCFRVTALCITGTGSKNRELLYWPKSIYIFERKDKLLFKSKERLYIANLLKVALDYLVVCCVRILGNKEGPLYFFRETWLDYFYLVKRDLVFFYLFVIRDFAWTWTNFGNYPWRVNSLNIFTWMHFAKWYRGPATKELCRNANFTRYTNIKTKNVLSSYYRLNGFPWDQNFRTPQCDRRRKVIAVFKWSVRIQGNILYLLNIKQLICSCAWKQLLICALRSPGR